MGVLRSTWAHQHHDLVLAKGECGKYPGVSVEYPFFFHSRVARADVVRATFVTLLPGTPFGMVCLFCGSLRHRARDLENVAFSNLRSRLLVYSNRLRLLCYAALAARPPSNDLNVLSCQLSHAPLFPSHLFLIFSHPHSIIVLLVFFAPPSLKTLRSNHRAEKKRNNFAKQAAD